MIHDLFNMMHLRRGWVAATLALAWVLGAPVAAQTVVVERTITLPNPADAYAGWPTMTRLADGRLAVVFSGNRRGHVGPYGRVEMMFSSDQGATWTDPIEVFDSPTDDRDAGIVQTPAGTVLVTTFTSNGWSDRYLKEIEAAWPPEEGVYRTWYNSPIDQTKLDDWRRRRDAIPRRWRGEMQGWILRMPGPDQPWSQLVATPVHTPHGPIVLNDGTLLLLGRSKARLEAHRSEDDGLTWSHLGDVPVRSGDDAATDYHEAHVAQLESGRLVAHIRHHGERNKYELLQTVSEDGGATWSVPESTGIWGFPAHLLALGGERVMTTYGKRREPFSIAVRTSEDGGRVWSDESIIAELPPHNDMGYPSTVRLSDNTFATLWYCARTANQYQSDLIFASWRLPD